VKRILFVDDEPRVLDGLKRMLYPLRAEWQMAFVSSGHEALRSLSEAEYDVLVTDVRMPGMSGIELLSEVVKRYPQVVRLVLSGTADQELTLRSVTLAHQYLVKPCDAAKLRATVERAFGLRVMLEDRALKQLVSRIHSLPSIPATYLNLMEALQSPEVSPKDIGRIVSQDIGMTAKILQLVNSAFFGVCRRITNPAEAVVYLGIDTVRALALTVSVFSQFDTRRAPGFSIETLRDHSLAVAALAKPVARSLGLPPAAVDDAFVGGLLHDLGKLVLVCNYPEQYETATQEARQEQIPDRDAESRIFGTSHAEVGAYLLWLWGLPDPVTEVVANHHRLDRQQAQTPGPVVAVHIADALIRGSERHLDVDYLTRMGLAAGLPRWKELHEEMLAEK